MQLDERNEAAVSSLIKPRLLKGFHPPVGVHAQLLGFFKAGGIRMQGIQINHGGENRVPPRILLETAGDIVLHGGEISSSSPMNSSFLSGVRDQHRFLHVDAEVRQMPLQDGIGERLLCWTFNEEVETGHQ